MAVEVKGSSYPRFPASDGAQIQAGHLEYLLPVLKQAFFLGDQVGDIGHGETKSDQANRLKKL